MSNQEFMQKYGLREFYDMIDSIENILFILKVNRKIGGFRCSKRKRRATIYLKDNTQMVVDYATIFTNKEFYKKGGK